MRRLITRWIVGCCIGTLIVAVTSPLFVRSYVPLEPDSIRGVWTLPQGMTYRWRSEGYANTIVGPHGMPGRTQFDQKQNGEIRIALWGDSQAEGVGLHDHDKLFAQSERLAAEIGNDWSVLPFARSGEDAAAWLTQVPSVESAWQVDVHVMLIVDLEDLFTAPNAPLPAPNEGDVEQANAALANSVPAFVIQGARYLLTESDEVTRRKLRFSLGKVEPKNVQKTSEPTEPERVDWKPIVRSLQKASRRPVVILYAPQLPSIVDGQVVSADKNAASFQSLLAATTDTSIMVVDLRADFAASVNAGQWPHGFHNGQFGVGHLNATGYQMIAKRLVHAVQQATDGLQ